MKAQDIVKRRAQWGCFDHRGLSRTWHSEDPLATINRLVEVLDNQEYHSAL
jgi:hypothetical protein